MYKTIASSIGVKAKLAITATAIFLIFRYCIPYVRPHISHPTGGSWETSWPAVIRPKTFADRWLDAELLHPFDASVIRDYCAATDWRTNVVFNLQGATGGVGNVRASVLDFVFFALEVGTAIVLPGMVVRSNSDLYDVWHGTQANFSRMFDETHFLTMMQQLCPQMHIYQPGEEALGSMRVIDGQYPWRSRREDKDIGNTRSALRVSVDDWLASHDFDNATSTIINVDRTMWQADTRSLPSNLRLSWPMLVRINPSIRRYAGLAMAKLAEQHDVPMRPSDELHENAFMGVHLRTEADTVSAGWFDPMRVTEWGVDFDGQTDAYLSLAQERGLDVMYVATGNHSEFERFVDKAASEAPHMRLLSKFDLLSEEEIAALQALEWDQQGLVDLEILRRCSFFAGFAKSSFSAAISIARHQWLENHGRPLGRGWYMRELEDMHVAFDDDVSRMVGRNEVIERECPRGCWPF